LPYLLQNALQLAPTALPAGFHCRVPISGDINQAAERAKERLRQETPGVRMEEITVQATAEIGLENIWVFNDAHFRRVD
jgi:hypothetical protein